MTVTKAPPPSPVAVIGSRSYKDLEKVRAFVRSLPEDACVVSGGARGVDQAAEAEAKRLGLSVVSFRPERDGKEYRIRCYEWDPRGTAEGTWGFAKTFGQAAHMRNSFIVDRVVATSGCLVAYWDGSSPGTQSVIAKARRAGVLYDVIHEDEPEVIDLMEALAETVDAMKREGNE